MQKFHKVLCTILIIILTTTNTEPSFARKLSYYSNCRLNHEGNDGPGSINGDTYVGYRAPCQDKCKQTCKQTFGVGDSHSGIDPNQETINQCISACIQGQDFIGKTVNYSDDMYTYGEEERVSGCKTEGSLDIERITQSDQYTINVYPDIINTKDNATKVRITLDQSADNIIYPCGRKDVVLDPVFPNISKFAPENIFGAGEYKDRKNEYLSKIYANTTLKPQHDDKNTDTIHLQSKAKEALDNGVLYINKPLYNVMNQVFEDMQENKTTPPSEWLHDRKKRDKVSYSIEPREYHPCLSALSDDQWQNISATDLLSCRTNNNGAFTKTCKLTTLLQKLPPSCFPSWHIKNPGLTKTGIVMNQDDYVSISIAGNVIMGLSPCDQQNNKFQYYVDNKLLKMHATKSASKKAFDNKQCKSMIKPNINGVASLRTNLQDISLRRKLSDKKYEQNDENIVFHLCDKNKFKSQCKSWNGLECDIIDSPVYMPYKSENDAFDNEEISESDAKGKDIKCSDILDPGSEMYQLAGKYQGSGGAQELLMGLPQPGKFAEFAGGYKVNVSWQSKAISDGDKMEIAFIKYQDFKQLTSSANSNIKIRWNSKIGEKLKKDGTFKISNKDMLSMAQAKTGDNLVMLFRIPSFHAEYSQYNKIQKNYCDISKQMGNYKINVKVYGLGKNDDFIISAIEKIRRLLYGTSPCKIDPPCNVETENCGIIAHLYHSVIRYTAPIASVILFLYIAILSLSFMMGLAKIDTRELINRVIKFSFVFAITVSMQSWNIVGSRIVSFGICGTETLIYIMTGGDPKDLSSDVLLNAALSQDDISIKHLFDLDRLKHTRGVDEEIKKDAQANVDNNSTNGGIASLIAGIFNSTLGAKLLALTLSGLTGAGTAIIMIVALMSMAFFVIKVALNYVFSIGVLGLFAILTPVMVPLMLFEQTKEVFTGFVKQFIVAMLSPIMAFVIYAFCGSVLINLVNAMLNFTVCKSCLIKLDFALLNICLIESWSLLIKSHSSNLSGPLVGFSPMGIMLSAISAYVVVNVAGSLLNKIGDVLGRIVQVRPIGSSHGASGTMGMASTLLEPVDEVKGKLMGNATGAMKKLTDKDVKGAARALVGKKDKYVQASEREGSKNKAETLGQKYDNIKAKNEED